MTRLKKPKLVTVPITELANSGNGRGYHDANKIEVPFSLPGDTVKAFMYRKRSGVFHSKLNEFVERSADRIPARCSHFADCGGCRLQHLSYDKQLAFKQNVVKSCFDEIVTCAINSIIPCEDIWQYRNKMEFTFSTDLSGKRYLGLIQDSSRGRVCSLNECLLTPDWFIEALKNVYDWWEKSGLMHYNPHRNSGTVRYLTLREGKRTKERMVILSISGELDIEHRKTLIEALKDSTSIILRTQKRAQGVATEFIDECLCGQEVIHEQLQLSRSLTFRISPSAFFQPNTLQAERLYSIALALADIPPEAIVYDLYCGTGTLSLCAALQSKQVIGIELIPQAVRDARLNAEMNGLTNVIFLEGDVGVVLTKIKVEKNFPNPDLVIVDPPRAGLDPRALQNIIDLAAPKIVYISCNPATQSQNIKTLIQHGYVLTHLQPLDLVPHTVHIESIAILVKGASL